MIFKLSLIDHFIHFIPPLDNLGKLEKCTNLRKKKMLTWYITFGSMKRTTMKRECCLYTELTSSSITI